jgi:hypothetical protein
MGALAVMAVVLHHHLLVLHHHLLVLHHHLPVLAMLAPPG